MLLRSIQCICFNTALADQTCEYPDSWHIFALMRAWAIDCCQTECPSGDVTILNPADIESIDVLKDGALPLSTRYTGSSNGVILVNQKGVGEVHTTYSAVTFNKSKKGSTL